LKDWESCERRVAEKSGGKHLPVFGRARGYAPNVSHDRLTIAVKNRKTLPAWLLNALTQAQAATKDGRMPVAILRQDHQQYRDALVVVRLNDFIQYWRGANRGVDGLERCHFGGARTERYRRLGMSSPMRRRR
jgi:hypothetical protein